MSKPAMTTPSSMSIKMQAVAQLVPCAKNARLHPEQQITQIMGSIKAFGFNNPVLVNTENRIIAGHGRVLAAERLGIDEVPTIQLEHLSESELRAFMLADNRIAENSSWDTELLSLEMADLTELGLDVTVTGFTDAEINKCLSAGTEPDPSEDETPEVAEEIVSRPGDLWALGKHRVLCGDATSEEDVARLFDGARPELMVTDPPYGVEYQAEWREKVHGAAAAPRSTGAVTNDDRVDWEEAFRLFPGDVCYVWHAAGKAVESAKTLDDLGFERRSQIIWKKQHFAISRGHYHWGHEPCWYCVRQGKTGHWLGDRKQSTVWEVPNASAFGGNSDDSKTIHSTQKPVEIMRRPILNHTMPADAVYDPFLGSGTSIIAAENTKRRAYGLEIEPRYIDVIARRWQVFAGAEAILEGDGRTFEEVAVARKRERSA